MSINLKVRITHDLDIGELIPRIESALAEILHLQTIPTILAEEYRSGTWLPLSSKHLNIKSPIVGFSITGEGVLVWASVYNRHKEYFTADDWEEGELGDVISIETGDPNVPIALALLASVAIAVGRANNSLITDDKPFYTDKFDSLPNDFARAVEVGSRYSDYRLAATEFAKQFVKL